MNRSLLRFFLPLIFLPLSGVAAAIGLGELRGQPALGERQPADERAGALRDLPSAHRTGIAGR